MVHYANENLDRRSGSIPILYFTKEVFNDFLNVLIESVRAYLIYLYNELRLTWKKINVPSVVSNNKEDEREHQRRKWRVRKINTGRLIPSSLFCKMNKQRREYQSGWCSDGHGDLEIFESSDLLRSNLLRLIWFYMYTELNFQHQK